jgi:large subunit ribosomal protein L30e
MIDVNREIRRAVDTGKVLFGAEQSEKSILKGKGRLIIIADNVPERVGDRLVPLAESSGIPVYRFNDGSRKLGSLCGKPFSVSVMSVMDEGKSKVMQLSEVREQ